MILCRIQPEVEGLGKHTLWSSFISCHVKQLSVHTWETGRSDWERILGKYGWPAHWPWGRVFVNGPEDWGSISGRVIPKTKWYLISPCIVRYVSRVKWSNRGKGVALFHTPRCSSYWKGSFRVALDYGRQLMVL